MADLTSSRPLSGRRILICRPAGQERPLIDHFQSLGAESCSFAALSISACELSPETQAHLDHLDRYQWAVFVSANAVEFGLAAVKARGPWPSTLRCAAVGQATALRLEDEGLGPVLRPTGTEDSEGLLRAPGWGPLQGQRILIFRGKGGRETLATGLREAGATVDYAEIYQRLASNEDPGPLKALVISQEISAICAMSTETLHNVFDAFGVECRTSLCSIPWVVPHPRIASAARDMGIQEVIESPGSQLNAVSGALINYFR